MAAPLSTWRTPLGHRYVELGRGAVLSDGLSSFQGRAGVGGFAVRVWPLANASLQPKGKSHNSHPLQLPRPYEPHSARFLPPPPLSIRYFASLLRVRTGLLPFSGPCGLGGCRWPVGSFSLAAFLSKTFANTDHCTHPDTPTPRSHPTPAPNSSPVA
jgi:hypothetical protein